MSGAPWELVAAAKLLANCFVFLLWLAIVAIAISPAGKEYRPPWQLRLFAILSVWPGLALVFAVWGDRWGWFTP